jgi:hypothetical protein
MISSVRFALKIGQRFPMMVHFFWPYGSKQARLDGSLAFVGGFMLFCFAKPEQNSFRRESSDATLVYKWFLSSQSARNKNNGEEEK